MVTGHTPAVIIIGLDGGTFAVIDPLIKMGHLPALASIAGSLRRDLVSTVPPLTPVAWSSMMTGVGPGKHGIFGFIEFDRQNLTARLLRGSDIAAPTLWELLSANDVRVGTVNVPWTFPPQKINGFMVSGLDTPTVDERMFWPRELYTRLQAELGSFPRYFIGSPPSREPFDLAAVHRQIELQARMSSWLIDEYQPDVFMVVFGATDYMQHYFWGRKNVLCNTEEAPDDLVAHTYECVDEQVRRLLDRHADGGTTVLVVSDHGAQAIRASLNVNLWLEQNGFLRRAGRPRAAGGNSHLIRLGRTLVHRLPFLRPLASRYKQGQWDRVLSSLIGQIDWENSRAVCVSAYGGLVTNGDVEALEADLRHAMAGLADPDTGEPVICDIIRSDEIYDGPCAGKAPQLWLVPTKHQYLLMTQWERSPWPLLEVEAALPADVLTPPFIAGAHSPRGVFMAAGHRLDALVLPETLKLTDIATLVLALLDFRPPEYVDGSVFTTDDEGRDLIMPAGFHDSAVYSDEDEASVKRRLEQLGYL